MIRTPITVRPMPPMPPAMEVPPIITAAMALSSWPVPREDWAKSRARGFHYRGQTGEESPEHIVDDPALVHRHPGETRHFLLPPME